MSDEIQSLIDRQRLIHLARTTDPDTSHEAAAAGYRFDAQNLELLEA